MTTVVIAYDGTDNAKRAIDYTKKFIHADRAIVLTAWEPIVRQAARVSGLSGVMSAEWSTDPDEDAALVDAKAVNKEGLELAQSLGFADSVGELAECTSTIWGAIIGAADRLGADLIVSGTRGVTGIKSLLSSSVAEHVLRYGHRPVLIVPPGN